MKPELLATLRAAGEAATAGPYAVFFDKETGFCDLMPAGRGGDVAKLLTESDAHFFAYARRHWDELLDAAEERDRLRAALRRYGNHDDCYRAGVDACPRYDNDNGGDPSRPCTCGFSAALGKEAP